MTFRRSLTVLLVGFCLLCAGLVIQSAVIRPAPGSNKRALLLLQQTTDVNNEPAAIAPAPAPAPASPQLQAAPEESYNAVGGPAETVTVGSFDPESPFKFQLELDSRGAAIRKAIFSEYNDRDPENPQPLAFLSPVQIGAGREMLSMANKKLHLVDQQRSLNLSRLSWKTLGVTTDGQGASVVSFEATITDSQDEPFLRLTKSYRVMHTHD